MEQLEVSGKLFRTAFVLFLVLAISALFLAVAWPFLKPLMLGAILAGLFNPLFRFMVRLFRGRRSLASATTLVIICLIIAGPVSAFLGIVLKQAVGVSNQAIPWVQDQFGGAEALDIRAWVSEKFPMVADYIPSKEDVIKRAGEVAQSAGGYLVSSASALTAGTAGLLLDLFVMLYAMFFFLKDGRRILERIFYYMPLSHEDEVRILQRFVSIARATIKGTLLIGLIQGGLAGAAFALAGIDGSAFWGTIMVILSIIPGIGSALVWMPAVIYLYAIGEPVKATLLGAWCAGVVGTIDNILRPTLVGKDAEIPDLLILVGTLGGLFLFGPIGFIIGPVVCGLFLTAWDIYGAAFRDILPPVKNLRLRKALSESGASKVSSEGKPTSSPDEPPGDPPPPTDQQV